MRVIWPSVSLYLTVCLMQIDSLMTLIKRKFLCTLSIYNGTYGHEVFRVSWQCIDRQEHVEGSVLIVFAEKICKSSSLFFSAGKQCFCKQLKMSSCLNYKCCYFCTIVTGPKFLKKLPYMCLFFFKVNTWIDFDDVLHCEKTCLWAYANCACPDQTARLCSLVTGCTVCPDR